MANLKSNSPFSRRIVRAFLDFLDCVEPAPGVDAESLEVARECLAGAFKLDVNSADDPIQPGLLVNLFRSLDSNDRNPADGHRSQVHQEEDGTTQPGGVGMSNDELFGQFFAALEKIHFFKATPDGKDDSIQLDKATRLFHEALNEMERSGCQSYNRNSLAEALKSQGNKALQLKRYYDAIELYSCAIALCEKNAVYYCNRAAAYTQVQKYAEAIRDCLKSIEIDPSYSKAYSRLGFVYYAQGNYRDAIDKGFKKALQLDPKNASMMENIQAAEEKLKEEQSWGQNSSSSGVPPPFGSMPFDPSSIPMNFANMMRNVMPDVQHTGEHHEQGGQGPTRNPPDEPHQQPGAGVGGSMNINLGEMMPDELRGALRSAMEMFSGAAPPPTGNADQSSSSGRSATH
ncbi:unnamed protein product [Linum trigynum]|uniref:Small glutamine-rich tetratricopeptide repeat-containing protein n=1 Tax=Linum trigynum TaxID=586398 RepID=A0AAV2CZW3_9ROSI